MVYSTDKQFVLLQYSEDKKVIDTIIEGKGAIIPCITDASATLNQPSVLVARERLQILLGIYNGIYLRTNVSYWKYCIVTAEEYAQLTGIHVSRNLTAILNRLNLDLNEG